MRSFFLALFSIPEHISIGFDPETRALIDRIVSLAEGKTQAQIDALAARLNVSRDALAATLAANPDPNPND